MTCFSNVKNTPQSLGEKYLQVASLPLIATNIHSDTICLRCYAVFIVHLLLCSDSQLSNRIAAHLNSYKDVFGGLVSSFF